MKDNEQRAAAKAFAEYWSTRGDEKSDSQSFWLTLLRDVLGVAEPEKFIFFEERVILDHTSFIDGHIPSTHVLIEQKKRGKSLTAPIKQSDGSLLSPFGQAQRYSAALPYSQRPRWIVTCNFEQFLIYDMEKPNGEPDSIMLRDLPKECYRLGFLIDTGNENIKRETEVSIKAGALVGSLYDEILKNYIEPDAETLKSLNKLIVRLVFCLYAEDSGIFGGHTKFHDYVRSFPARDLRRALMDLFRILDTKPELRDKYEDKALLAFPYVNGGLFADEAIEIPQLGDNVRDLILHNASEEFDWSAISPTIFGAVFESTLNPETRRSGGMHYTSIENIHKVINPLFLDDLRSEFEQIKDIKVEKTKITKLAEFRTKLGKLTFLDPACGSGNFLTETYISLRRLENEAIAEVNNGQIVFDQDDIIKVSIGQFYGIEINDFAVTVAKTALWIAESQMMKETEDIIHMSLDFLPLKSYANIVEGNALRIDWESVVAKDELDYIMGNPPFVGMKEMTTENKEDMQLVIPIKKFKQLDYVSSWYFKSAEYINNTNIEVAFVSSNSITQGEQALTMWKPLFEKFEIVINFAHRTFKWASESSNQAAVHCVIIGFSKNSRAEKYIYENGRPSKCTVINQYISPSEIAFIEKTGKPLCDVQIMTKGAQLIDGGNFIVGNRAEYENVIKHYPEISPYIRRYYNARYLLNNGEKIYVLYLENCPPNILKNKYIYEKVKAVYEYRANNESPSTNALKDTPSQYFQSQAPAKESVVIPVVSSENRKYIPICFMPQGCVYTNAMFYIDDATLYTFGVLTSNVHMAWTRTLCGRMKSDYRYSNTMVYNTFPWPTPTDEQRAAIEKTAQAILDARALYPDCSLADLYDELTMPPELRKAHQANDKAVMQAYGFWGKLNSESACVAELMKMYRELTE